MALRAMIAVAGQTDFPELRIIEVGHRDAAGVGADGAAEPDFQYAMRHVVVLLRGCRGHETRQQHHAPGHGAGQEQGARYERRHEDVAAA
jgi:hypothetical protein